MYMYVISSQSIWSVVADGFTPMFWSLPNQYSMSTFLVWNPPQSPALDYKPSPMFSGGLLIDEETDLPQLRRVLADLMLAAVLSRVDLVPWLLEGLVGRLRQVTAQFGAIVPPGLYLPAPPVYCPQPANTSQAALSEDDSHEVALRHEASSLIQLVLLILEGANCTLPAARWYSTKVQEAVINGRRFKVSRWSWSCN